MGYDFKVKHDVEVPEVVRQGAQAYGFPFSEVTNAKQKKTAEFYVGRDFWLANGLTAEQIDKPSGKGKPSGAADIKDRIKRAFTGWQAKNDKSKKFRIVAVDDKAEDGTYRGVFIYLRPTDVAKTVRKKAA